MSNLRYCKLIMTTEQNNNKYYEMQENDDKSISISYGRVDSSKLEEVSNKKWESLYSSKIKKGYKDVTQLVSKPTETKEYEKEKDLDVHHFITKMKAYTKDIVNKTYIKAENITNQQIEKAQEVLNNIKQLGEDKDLINKVLLELYTVIPRKMNNVKGFLLPSIDLGKTLVEEQEYLDTVKSYVKDNNIEEVSGSYLGAIGVEIFKTSDTSEISHITSQLKSIKNIFKVNYEKENTRFNDFMWNQKNKSKKFLIHGTRCFSVLPIIEQGLKIRPSGNFSFSGKAYGDGTYFSEITTKSLNYTGGDPDKILLIYEVYTGNPFIYEGWYKGNSFTLNENELSSRGFNSTYVKAGNGLLNSEIIVYNESQYRLTYILHI